MFMVCFLRFFSSSSCVSDLKVKFPCSLFRWWRPPWRERPIRETRLQGRALSWWRYNNSIYLAFIFVLHYTVLLSWWRYYTSIYLGFKFVLHYTVFFAIVEVHFFYTILYFCHGVGTTPPFTLVLHLFYNILSVCHGGGTTTPFILFLHFYTLYYVFSLLYSNMFLSSTCCPSHFKRRHPSHLHCSYRKSVH